MLKKNTKIYILFIIIVTLVTLFTLYVGKNIITFVSDPLKFRLWVDSHGILGPITYILITIIQIIACFIPGEPLELVAGYAFGTLNGFIYCLLAETIGSVIVIYLTKKYGIKLLSIFFNRDKLDSLKILKTNKNRFLLFTILFTLPGTPKDLLCYYAGLCDYPLIPLLIVTSLGRIPAIITSVIGASALGNKKYELTIIIFFITLLISFLGLFIYKKLTSKKSA